MRASAPTDNVVGLAFMIVQPTDELCSLFGSDLDGARISRDAVPDPLRKRDTVFDARIEDSVRSTLPRGLINCQLPQCVDERLGQVLVDQQPHGRGQAAGMMRLRRSLSAANARQARMSSRESCGKSCRI